MDTQKAAQTIEAALQALHELEQALDENDRLTIDKELWNARRELLKLLKMFEAPKPTER